MTDGTAAPASSPPYSVVVPTVGRPSLGRLLAALARDPGPAPVEVLVVDDRPVPGSPLRPVADGLAVQVIRSGGVGPAGARNRGWREVTAEWVAFLDDDVVPSPSWRRDLAADLDSLPWQIAATQGRLRVPLPGGRRPTDWERNVAGLEGARWATADLAYRRSVLEEVGGFDERFPRAFREDADLGLRVTAAGYLIVQGERRCDHPVRTADRWVSVRLQAGNADDVLMRALHGSSWRRRCGAEDGRTARHVLTTVAATVALAGIGRRDRRWAVVGTAGWMVGTAELARARIRPGPRTGGEVTTMVLTSIVLPTAAVLHGLGACVRLPRILADRDRSPLGLGRPGVPRALLRRVRRGPRWRADHQWRPQAILFDRDGTLIVDRPGNTDATRVALMPGSRVAVARARAEGLALGVVTNQSAVGEGTLSPAELDVINGTVDDLCGPFGTWQVCPHREQDRCRCRKPEPGLIEAAATELGVEIDRCAVIGDIGADLTAAARAGARSVLVPTRRTRRAEIAGAGVVASDLLGAVDLILAGRC